jgi:alpha-tubulin suppressor-like RCC1 family protein
MRLEPTLVKGGLTFTDITAGGYHTCGLTNERWVYCWGRTRFPGGPNTSNLIPKRVVDMQAGVIDGSLAQFTFTQISAGSTHVCAMSTDGFARCWGERDFGQLGWALPPTAPCSFDARVCGGFAFSDVHAGDRFSCGRTSGGISYCWGYNAAGQLGDGTTTQHDLPAAVSGSIAFSQIAPGGAHACGIALSGPSYCWGYNAAGQLGNGTRVDLAVPGLVTSTLPFVELAAGGSHTCGRIASGQVFCWGENSSGQLGDGTSTGRTTPVLVKAQ